jgi:hypothetical protein
LATSPTNTGWNWASALEKRELVQQIVLGAEHDGTAENRGGERGVANHLFAVAAGAQIHARTLRIGADRAHVQKPPHALRLARRDDLPRQLDMRFRELGAVRVAAPPLQDADEIDDRVRFRHEGGELRRIMHVGLDHVDGKQGEMRGIGAAPRRDAHVLAEFDERVHEMTADEARTADQRYFLMSHIRLCGGGCGTSVGAAAGRSV